MDSQEVDRKYETAMEMLSAIEEDFSVEMSRKESNVTMNPEFLKWNPSGIEVGTFMHTAILTTGKRKSELVYLPEDGEVKLHYHPNATETIKVIEGAVYYEHYSDKYGMKLLKQGVLKEGDSLNIAMKDQAHYVLSSEKIALLYVIFYDS